MSVGGSTSSPETVKRCCAVVYDQDWLPLLLGEAYHPGGAELTRALARRLGLRPGERVLDVASGPGSTALLLAREFGVTVEGVDLAEGAVHRAGERAAREGLDGAVRFSVGDAERLPVADGTVDVVICECALCTFPDKPAAVSEFARVLRRGGRIGIADIVLDPERLDPALRSLAGRVACLADARPLGAYGAIMDGAGFRVVHVEQHPESLARMIERIRAALAVLEMAALPALDGLDLTRAWDLAERAARSVDEGVAGYALIVAETP
ncbi:MAG: methyltransferase domain-containing protein [Actinobacteria bacterium]|nr:methyltransferase domain-containing protein [Actinomycetota bacterium]